MSSYQSNQIKLINTSLIDPHPDNPRKNIGDVTDLAASIKTNGLLTPLSVVPNGERYRVIAGHRRLAATRPPTPKRKPDAPPNRPNATPAATRSRNTPPHPRTSA